MIHLQDGHYAHPRRVASSTMVSITCRGGQLRDTDVAAGQCLQPQPQHAAGVARWQCTGGALHRSVLVVNPAWRGMSNKVNGQVYFGKASRSMGGHYLVDSADSTPIPVRSCRFRDFVCYSSAPIIDLSPAVLPFFGDVSSIVYAFFSNTFSGILLEVVSSLNLWQMRVEQVMHPQLRSIILQACLNGGHNWSGGPSGNAAVSPNSNPSVTRSCLS